MEPKAATPLQIAFRSHSRHWRDLRYVYPVISRRTKGLSIGINLNPDRLCNFDCIYCQVDRSSEPPVRSVDLEILQRELRGLLENRDKLFDSKEFRDIPPDFRRVADIAFSGDGEPTASPHFPQAAQIAVDLKAEFRLASVKILVLTDACYLTRPAVTEALALLDRHNGEIWAKLDAGTEEYFQRVNVPSHSLDHVLQNILAVARVRPVVIQSLFMRIDGEPPPASEIGAYVDRLRGLCDAGGRVRQVQVYTVARNPAQPCVSALSADELERIADRVRSAGLPVERIA